MPFAFVCPKAMEAPTYSKFAHTTEFLDKVVFSECSRAEDLNNDAVCPLCFGVASNDHNYHMSKKIPHWLTFHRFATLCHVVFAYDHVFTTSIEWLTRFGRIDKNECEIPVGGADLVAAMHTRALSLHDFTDDEKATLARMVAALSIVVAAYTAEDKSAVFVTPSPQLQEAMSYADDTSGDFRAFCAYHNRSKDGEKPPKHEKHQCETVCEDDCPCESAFTCF